MNLPLISIGLIVYNHSRYIEDTLKSLLSQTYSPLELIILDDGSNDGTKDIIKKYIFRLREKFIRVKEIYNVHNVGNIPRNCNDMIKYAHGDYYFDFSGDDILLPQGIETLYRSLIKYPNCNIVYANMIYIEDDFHYGMRYDEHKLALKAKKEGIEAEDLFFRLMDNNIITAPTVLLAKKVYDLYGYYDESIAYEDYEYWIRLSLNETFLYIDTPVVLYRKSDNSYSDYRNTDTGLKKLYIAIDAEYKTKKKYMRFLTKIEQVACLKKFFYNYYDYCKINGYMDAISYLQMLMNEENIIFENTYIKIKECRKKAAEILNLWLNNKIITDNIMAYFVNKNISRIAIYGYSRLGRRLIKVLSSSNIKIDYIIDQKGRMLNALLPVYTMDDKLPLVDAIVVTVAESHENIAIQLKNKFNLLVIDLMEFLMRFE